MVDLKETHITDIKSLMTSTPDPNKSYPAGFGTNIEKFQRRQWTGDDLSELYHENTKLNRRIQQESKATVSHLDQPGMLYVQSKIEPDRRGRERIELPDPEQLTDSITDVMFGRRSTREFGDKPLDLARLSTILGHASGVSARNHSFIPETSLSEEEMAQHAKNAAVNQVVEQTMRTYPSPGGLYPTELYLCVTNVDGIEPGVYYYSPEKHVLRVIDREFDSFNDAIDDCFFTRGLRASDGAVAFALTASFWRAKAKYGARGYRYILQESGHLVQNLLLAATAVETGGVPLAAFKDNALNDLIGVDGINEAITYTMILGTHVPDTNQ